MIALFMLVMVGYVFLFVIGSLAIAVGTSNKSVGQAGAVILLWISLFALTYRPWLDFAFGLVL